MKDSGIQKCRRILLVKNSDCHEHYWQDLLLFHSKNGYSEKIYEIKRSPIVESHNPIPDSASPDNYYN